MKSKSITQFDVFNKMPEGSIDMSNSLIGGRTLGKKSNNHAVIEVLVDNKTFQDFAFQKMCGHPKEKSKRRYYMFYSVDADEYDKQHDLLKSKNQSTLIK